MLSMTFNQIIHHIFRDIFSSHLDCRCHVSTQCFESKQSSSELSLLQMHLLTCAVLSEIHDANTSMMANSLSTCTCSARVNYFQHFKYRKYIYQSNLSEVSLIPQYLRLVPLVCGAFRALMSSLQIFNLCHAHYKQILATSKCRSGHVYSPWLTWFIPRVDIQMNSFVPRYCSLSITYVAWWKVAPESYYITALSKD